MRQPNDAIRSLRKYVAESLVLLAPPAQGYRWEVRFADEKGTFKRPFCQVQETTPVTVRTIGSTQQELAQGYAVLCHPLIPEDAVSARLQAGDLQDVLYRIFAVGTLAGEQHGNVKHPMRVPLYDYAGVPITQPVDVASWDRSFARIPDPPTVNVTRDETDELYYTVTANIRMSWTRSAAVPSGGVILQSVRPRPEATP